MRALTELKQDFDALAKPEVFILGYEIAWGESRQLTEDIVNEFARREETE